MRSLVCLLGLTSLVLALHACGGDDEDPGLTIYAGIFSATESFNRQEGNQCPPPPGGSTDNTVDVRIEKSRFEARFELKWGILYGEIHETLEFLAVDADALPDRTFELTGLYADENEFSGTIKETKQGCARYFNIFAQRVVQEDQ